MRAYTDAVASALKAAAKIPIVQLVTLRCAVPYALEGMLRREVAAAGGALGAVTHGDEVGFVFTLPEDDASALVARLNEAGQGRVVWAEDSA